MKKFVLWMIRVFKLDIPTEKIVTKVVEKQVLIPEKGVIEGDVIIKGNVLFTGKVFIAGEATFSTQSDVKWDQKFDGNKED